MMSVHPDTLLRDIVRADRAERPLGLTAILVIVGDYASGEKVLACLARQSAARDMELILVSDHTDTLSAAAPLLPAFGAVQLIIGDTERLPYLRAACAARAQAPIVAFNEDHAFVEPHWATSLLHVFAADERTVAVAACMTNANPRSTISRAQYAAFFARYDREAWGTGDHELDALPWHNTVYRRTALVAAARHSGVSTGEALEVEGTLQRQLREVYADARFVLTTRTSIGHVNMSRLGPALQHAVTGGRLFAADRSLQQGWSWPHRLARAGAAPLVPLVRIWRDRARLAAGQRDASDGLRLLQHATLLAIAHAAGETLGLLGGRSIAHVRRYADFECRRARFVEAEDRALLVP
jgi:hypothetical protein